MNTSFQDIQNRLQRYKKKCTYASYNKFLSNKNQQCVNFYTFFHNIYTYI